MSAAQRIWASDLGLFEFNEAAEIVWQSAHPDTNIISAPVLDD
jgi:hypothetical protein